MVDARSVAAIFDLSFIVYMFSRHDYDQVRIFANANHIVRTAPHM
jgi:hypothetical protein